MCDDLYGPWVAVQIGGHLIFSMLLVFSGCHMGLEQNFSHPVATSVRNSFFSSLPHKHWAFAVAKAGNLTVVSQMSILGPKQKQKEQRFPARRSCHSLQGQIGLSHLDQARILPRSQNGYRGGSSSMDVSNVF